MAIDHLGLYPQPWRIEKTGDGYREIVAANGNTVCDLSGYVPALGHDPKDQAWRRSQALAEYIIAAVGNITPEQHLCKHPEDEERQQTETHCGLCGKVSA